MMFAATVSASVIASNWQRYSANPSVVSLEKDFREWEFEFPAVTICYHNKVDESKAQEYIRTLVVLCYYSFKYQICDTLKR
jgi:hypothetical protein